jgi:hypothetical protein
MILPISEGLRRALFLFTKGAERLNTRSEGTDDAGMARYFWLIYLILDRRLHFSPITAVLLCQYKTEHHVIAANAYLLFGQKSTNLTILFSESECRIVQLIWNRFLGSSAWFKTPTNWLSVIIDHRNTTNNLPIVCALYFMVAWLSIFSIVALLHYLQAVLLSSPGL